MFEGGFDPGRTLDMTLDEFLFWEGMAGEWFEHKAEVVRKAMQQQQRGRGR